MVGHKGERLRFALNTLAVVTNERCESIAEHLRREIGQGRAS